MAGKLVGEWIGVHGSWSGELVVDAILAAAG